MDYEPYSESLELRDYIKRCKTIPPIERLRFVEEETRRLYELMPLDAKLRFEKLRLKDISDKFNESKDI